MGIKTSAVAAAFAVTVLVTLAAPSNATSISGSINLSGDFQPTLDGTPTQNLAKATGIDFLPLGGGSGSFSIGVATDDLATFSGQTGTIRDLTFAPFSSLTNFYTVASGGLTLGFDLTSLTVATQNANFLSLSGSGVMHLTGYQDTAGTWFFSGQSSGGASRQATFSWSAGSLASTDVPEPASLGLLGAGLAGIGLLRRRRESVAAA